jgi:hypothetical protein
MVAGARRTREARGMGNRRVALVVVAAVAFGWMVGPRMASAVGSLVSIQNAAGTQKAGVTKGQQLQVAEAAPGAFREFRTSSSDENCHAIVNIPAGKALVVRSLSFSVLSASSAGLEISLVYPNASCSGQEMYSVSTHEVGSHDVSIEPGFAIKNGGHLSVLQGGDGVYAVYVWGYLVPKGDVPATTPVG